MQTQNMNFQERDLTCSLSQAYLSKGSFYAQGSIKSKEPWLWNHTCVQIVALPLINYIMLGE